jgi:hypothetical protein
MNRSFPLAVMSIIAKATEVGVRDYLATAAVSGSQKQIY